MSTLGMALEIAPVDDKLRKPHLRWFGDIGKRIETTSISSK